MNAMLPLAILGIIVCLFAMVDTTRANVGQPARNSHDTFINTRWTTEDGLPQNTITAILQTRDGYLWLGTFGGLVRFDGMKFTVFNSGNTPALRRNRITSLYEDSDGVLWIGAETGEITRYENGEFIPFAPTEGMLAKRVLKIFQDHTGAIWLATGGSGLIQIEPGRPAKVATFDTKNGLPDDWVTSICQDNNGELWVGTLNGLASFRDGVFVEATSIEQRHKHVMLVSPHPKGGLWVLNWNSLGHFSNDRFTPVLDTARKLDLPPGGLAQGKAGDLWFSYVEKNLYHLKDGSISAIKLRLTTSAGLRAMLEDREGNLWLGANGEGLIRLRKPHVTVLSTTDGLPSAEVASVIEDQNGNVWIGTTKGLCRWSKGKIETCYQYGGDKSAWLSWIGALHVDRAGSLWGGRPDGVARFRDGRFTEYPLKDIGHVYVIFEDRRGQIWIGAESGLAQFHDGAIKLYQQADGLLHNEVRFITEDRMGAMWVGTIGGLCRFRDGVFTNYTKANGLSNDHVRAIYEDRDEALWIGTYGGGLNRLKNGRITRITRQDGLFDDVVSRILVDDHDRFWMLGNRGIFHASRQELNDFADGKIKAITCASYGVADGMLTSEGSGGNHPAGWRTRDGRLWFPTIRGLAIIDPNEPSPPPPLVAIEQVMLDHVPLRRGQPLEVVSGSGNIEISYTGLSLGKPEQVRFRYKLEGVDPDWIDVGTRRAVYFSHLPRGRYKFKVIAGSPDGVWSVQSAEIGINVSPPFWLTSWFFALLNSGLLIFVWFAYRLHVANLKRRQAQQEAFARQLIDSQEHERGRIAAELHDGLSQSLVIIKNRALSSLNSPGDHERALEQLREIAEASTQAIDEVKEIVYDLRPIQLDRLGLMGAVADMLYKVADLYGLEIVREFDEIKEPLPKEFESSLYRIIQESINNIIKHAEATRVEVKMKRNDGFIELIIRDNGKGFVRSNQRNVSRKDGLGLTVIGERARLLDGQVTIESAPGRGTSIFIRLPLKEERHAR
jgi:signal transduction histidine kinase/ligand-binding sensor domain-containing protein